MPGHRIDNPLLRPHITVAHSTRGLDGQCSQGRDGFQVNGPQGSLPRSWSRADTSTRMNSDPHTQDSTYPVSGNWGNQLSALSTVVVANRIWLVLVCAVSDRALFYVSVDAATADCEHMMFGQLQFLCIQRAGAFLAALRSVCWYRCALLRPPVPALLCRLRIATAPECCDIACHTTCPGDIAE